MDLFLRSTIFLRPYIIRMRIHASAACVECIVQLARNEMFKYSDVFLFLYIFYAMISELFATSFLVSLYKSVYSKPCPLRSSYWTAISHLLPIFPTNSPISFHRFDVYCIPLLDGCLPFLVKF